MTLGTSRNGQAHQKLSQALKSDDNLRGSLELSPTVLAHHLTIDKDSIHGMAQGGSQPSEDGGKSARGLNN
jgi:hypothetical protein